MAGDYEKALAHAKAGRLEAAQSILLGLEDERSERLLVKVNAAIAARGAQTQEKPKGKTQINRDAQAVKEGMLAYEKEKQQEKLKRQGIALIITLALLFSCCGWVSYLSSPRPAENVAKMCENVRRVNFQCDPTQIMGDYPEQVAYCQQTYGNYVDVDELKFTWQNCMRSQGIEFVPEN
jgi:hypothetical protein